MVWRTFGTNWHGCALHDGENGSSPDFLDLVVVPILGMIIPDLGMTSGATPPLRDDAS